MTCLKVFHSSTCGPFTVKLCIFKIRILSSVFTSFTLGNLTVSWGNPLFTVRPIVTPIWNPSSYNLPQQSLLSLNSSTGEAQCTSLLLTVWKQRTQVSLVLFCPFCLHVFRAASPSWPFSVNMIILSGSELNAPDNSNNRVNSLHPFSKDLTPGNVATDHSSTCYECYELVNSTSC